MTVQNAAQKPLNFERSLSAGQATERRFADILKAEGVPFVWNSIAANAAPWLPNFSAGNTKPIGLECGDEEIPLPDFSVVAGPAGVTWVEVKKNERPTFTRIHPQRWSVSVTGRAMDNMLSAQQRLGVPIVLVIHEQFEPIAGKVPVPGGDGECLRRREGWLVGRADVVGEGARWWNGGGKRGEARFFVRRDHFEVWRPDEPNAGQRLRALIAGLATSASGARRCMEALDRLRQA